MLQRLFEKYTGFLRSWKPVYVVNNLLNRGKLQHNRPLYRQYGLQKSLYSPLGSADFPQHHPDIPWLDQPNAQSRLETAPGFAALNATMQAGARQFVTEGYCILEQFFTPAQTAALNTEMDALLGTGKAGFNYTGRKIFNLHEQSPLADTRFFRHPDILRFLTFLIGKKVIPFQTLGFTQGSEQRAHSDSIHMTTEPPGYLIATWIALEDCTEENGPLFYFPGSHRLPYILTGDYPSGNTRWTIGSHSNRRYEDRIEQLIAAEKLVPKRFLARRGDVLIWHANLLHGGSRITQPGATRRSLVCHYFAEGVICYHEISQRPALIPPAEGNR